MKDAVRNLIFVMNTGILKESDIMLSKNGVIVRLLICMGLFFLSGSQLVTGSLGTICGVIGTVELATALLQYSPANDLRTLTDVSTDSTNAWELKATHE